MRDEAEGAAYYIEKARQCFILADLCHSPKLALEMQQVAYEFLGMAVSRGADAAAFPDQWHRNYREPPLKN